MMGFLSRKKDKAPGYDAAPPVTKKTKKGKKDQQEDVTPDFDLGSALPSVDDFRTSLIMPGLSTRFSMLREQDDPSSKIGKASDDSVLTPKRSSRLEEFGFAPGGLSDIAEVSSLSSSIRPPFASERTSSFDSDKTGDELGSIMSRARPGEGNVLFGGRQKIYMISNKSGSKGFGRTLYDDDVNMSAYQRLRAEEKERLRQEAEALNDQHSEPSSPTTLSQKRETSSSTNSGPENTRTSTAATSIASQGTPDVPVTSPALPPSAGPFPPADLNRSTTKTRRLYDQGLDQHIQEQQSSAMNRLNSIQRARAPTGRSIPQNPLSQTRSATNLNDRFHRGPMFRSDSPNALAHPGVVRNNSQLSSGGSSPVVPHSQSSPPASPVLSDHEEKQPLTAALQQGDRGKATAMGAFNKPKEAFSEQQYAERLRRMQLEREAPREVPGFPAPVMEPVPKSDKSPPRKPTLRERVEQERRKRAESVGRQRSESSASASTEASQAVAGISAFQAAANRMKAAANAAQMQSSNEATPLSQQQQSPDEQKCATFFAAHDSSEDDEPAPTRPTTARTVEAARRFENLPVATGPAPDIFEHPAMRSRNVSEEHVRQAASPNPSPMLPQGLSPMPDNVADRDIDSPTLGPNNGGLSGLIRQHLRSDSNVSSNYGETDQRTIPSTLNTPVGLAIQTQGIALQPRQPGSDSTTPAPSNYSHSNPWDLDDLDNPYRNDRGSFSSGSPLEGQRMQPEVNAGLGQQWDSRRNHERIASNETEAEHEAFQRDLAQRQRLIQENLRARAEGRSTSPAPGPSGGLKNALNMLRAKSSRESFAVVERQQTEVPHKGLRKMTLGTGSGNASTTSLVGSYIGEHWKAEMPSLKSKSSRLGQQSEQDPPRDVQTRQRSGTDSSRVGRPVGRSPPMASRGSTRERSGSGTSSGRSLSRAGQHHDDIENYPLPPDRPSTDSQSRTRSRSNSYFESKHLQPIQTSTPHPPLPVPSGIPQPKFSPGLPISPRPSPGGYSSPSMNAYQPSASPIGPFSANHTPPTSNPTTPNAAAFNPGAVQPLIRQGMLRKKSIAKSEISEPVFLSTTSVIDTVNLPPGASLRNGSELFVPPPVPPINPMRRRFGFGRSEGDKSSEGPTSHPDLDAPRAAYAEQVRTSSADAVTQIPQPRNRLRKSSSESKSLHNMAQGQPAVVPAMPPTNFLGRNTSAPRPINEQPIAQQNMDGAMF